MFCEKCGNQLVEDSAFCPQCGAKVENRESAVGKSEIPGHENGSPISHSSANVEELSEKIKGMSKELFDKSKEVSKGMLDKSKAMSKEMFDKPNVEENIQKLKGIPMVWKAAIAAGGILLIIVCFTLFRKPGKEVRDAYLPYYSEEVTVEEVFEAYFESPKWSTYESGDYSYVVFTGVCWYLEDRVDVRVTFKITGENFVVDRLDVNGQSQDDYMINLLLFDIYEEY